MEAYSERHLACVKDLLDKGVQVNMQKELLDKGVQVNMQKKLADNPPLIRYNRHTK